MERTKRNTVLPLMAFMALATFAEAPFAFRDRLTTVHRTDRRDLTCRVEEGEFAFVSGARIEIAADAPALVRDAAEDF